MKYPTIWWIIILAVITVAMPNGTFWEVASFCILTVASGIAIWRWGYPRFKQWRKNRVYSFSFIDGLKSQATHKSKVIEIGKREIFVRIKVTSEKHISRLSFNFRGVESGGGYTDRSIISFEDVKVDNMENLPYASSLEQSSQRVSATFTPVKLLGKGDSLSFAFTIDAKLPWFGRLEFEVFDENGLPTSYRQEFKVINARRQVLDVD